MSHRYVASSLLLEAMLASQHVLLDLNILASKVSKKRLSLSCNDEGQREHEQDQNQCLSKL